MTKVSFPRGKNIEELGSAERAISNISPRHAPHVRVEPPHFLAVETVNGLAAGWPEELSSPHINAGASWRGFKRGQIFAR
jgi:hypothetical protein